MKDKTRLMEKEQTTYWKIHELGKIIGIKTGNANHSLWDSNSKFQAWKWWNKNVKHFSRKMQMTKNMCDQEKYKDQMTDLTWEI